MAAKPAAENAEPIAQPVTETAAFKEALEAAVKVELDRLMPMLKDALLAAKGDAATVADDDASVPMFAKQLAHEIAGYSAQASGRFMVEPAELAARQKAFSEMETLLIELNAKAATFHEQNPRAEENPYVPRYRLTSKTQLLFPLNGQLVPVLVDPLYRDDITKRQRQTEVFHPTVPNLAMEPANDVAEQVSTLFRRFIGEAIPVDPRTGAKIFGDNDLGALALTRNGTVIRGGAAAAVLRNTRTDADQSPITLSAGGYMTTRIARGESEAYGRPVQVLGSLTQPIKVR